jgi:dienelactone hydrolase
MAPLQGSVRTSVRRQRPLMGKSRMHSEVLKYEANGLNLESVLYYDETKTGKRPAVLVFPEGFGLSEHSKEKAQRLAELGYVTLANDLYGEGKNVNTLDEVMAFVGPLVKDPRRIRAYAEAGLKALLARPEVDSSRIAAIGYCVGGTVALELARGGADVKGVAGFHSGLGTERPGDAKDIKGKVLVCIGADDPMNGPDLRQTFNEEMTAGKVDWQMHLYGGVVHSFTNKEAATRGHPDVMRYSASADRRSFQSLVNFLEEIFA